MECQSKTAAVQGISSVVLSRIGMACPGMGKFFDKYSRFTRVHGEFSSSVLTPFAVQYLTNKGFFNRRPWANTPIQLGLVGAILIFATPLGCALFSQTASINVSQVGNGWQCSSLFSPFWCFRYLHSNQRFRKRSEQKIRIYKWSTTTRDYKKLIEIRVVDVKLRILHLKIDFFCLNFSEGIFCKFIFWINSNKNVHFLHVAIL